MNDQQNINYKRIAEAIDYIKANFKAQPNLDEIARKVHLSPFHFQRNIWRLYVGQYKENCNYRLGRLKNTCSYLMSKFRVFLCQFYCNHHKSPPIKIKIVNECKKN